MTQTWRIEDSTTSLDDGVKLFLAILLSEELEGERKVKNIFSLIFREEYFFSEFHIYRMKKINFSQVGSVVV